MANIQKIGKDRFKLTVSGLGKDKDGKYIRRVKNVSCKTIKEAEIEWAKFKLEVEAGTYIAPEKKTLEVFVGEWHQQYATKHLGKKTVETYMGHFRTRIFPEFGHRRLDSLKTYELVNFFNKLTDGDRLDGQGGTLSPGTVQIIHRALKKLNRATEWRVIKANPMEGVKKPRTTAREMDVYNAGEVELMRMALEKESPMWRMLVSMAVTCGLRRGELLGLEWKHINLDAGTLEVKQALSFTKNERYEIKDPKTKKSIRTLMLPQFIVAELRKYKAHCNQLRLNAADLWEGGQHFFVFSGYQGKPLNPTSVKNFWKRFHAKNPQLKYIRIHDLRHTAATLLLNNGLPAKVISDMLGHASITTTMNVYAHTTMEAQQHAAKIMNDLLAGSSQL